MRAENYRKELNPDAQQGAADPINNTNPTGMSSSKMVDGRIYAGTREACCELSYSICQNQIYSTKSNS